MNGRRPAVGILAVLTLLLLGSSSAVRVTGAADKEEGATRAAEAETEATTPAPVATRPDPSLSVVAAAVVPRVGIYASAGAPTPKQSIANPNENGAPLVFLVQEDQGDWLRVLLPVSAQTAPPDGSGPLTCASAGTATASWWSWPLIASP